MKNQYVGDIGDYGKYGMLRFLARQGIKIGVNWYLTENDGSLDGKFIEYLNHFEERIYDPSLFDALRDIAFRSDKTVKMIQDADLISGAEYYEEVLKSSKVEAKTRELSRRLWFNNSTLVLQESELIFADPDNGIRYKKSAGTKDSEKFILPDEICRYYNSGKNVVFYCHKSRRKQEAWEETKVEIRRYIRDAQILAVTYHRGTQRSYIFVLHLDCYTKYRYMLTDFLKSSWRKVFSWESIGGNVSSTAVGQKNTPGITLEPLADRFSVCKVVDYSGIDLTQPFCFTGATDEEYSLACPEGLAPPNTTEREDGWRGFRIVEKLDFSLIGILARIYGILAEKGIGIFAISTFNTDYILTKEDNFEKALDTLKRLRYEML